MILEHSSYTGSKGLKVRDLQDSGETATVALIRMLTSNLQIILQDHFRATQLGAPTELVLDS